VDHVLETFQAFLKQAEMAAKDQATHLLLRDENMFGDNNNNDYVNKKKQKDTDARDDVVLKQPDNNDLIKETNVPSCTFEQLQESFDGQQERKSSQ
jgi:hypothetical protein